MATTSSRQTSLFGIQDWKKFFQTYAAADFTSYDYESLRKNFIDYLIRAYPETYNDYVESSEFVALLDVIAFMGQSMAFRSDLNARENFIDTAERRDSVIKLANLVSYSPKRNIAGQGMVKITGVMTTEDLTDINGNNLSGVTVLWNDPANRIWQEQFNTVLNASLINSQRIGRPGHSQTILGIKTDEYSVNMPLDVLPIVPFKTEVDSTSMNFELVSGTSINQTYVYEMSPAPTGQFNVLYRNDKLGYGSVNTGFFVLFKQGTLVSQDFVFPEKIKNNTQPVNVQGINNSDTWLYKVTDQGAISSEWTQVESVHVNTAQSQSGALSPVFSVASRSNDEITYLFSDGVFGEIPIGRFRAFYRTSNSLQYTIDPAEMSGISTTINYISRVGRQETLTLTLSLQEPSSTAQARESLSAIKERAPARYYTQNRMVNGEDYTNFPFTLYNSIIKSKALNRTSIGITRNLDLLDPTGKYSSTNVIATDGGIFFSAAPKTTSFSTLTPNYGTEFLQTTLPSLLSSPESIQFYQQYYTRQSGNYSASADNRCYWNQSSVTSTQTTGYFYVDSSTPIPVGTYSAYNPKYITKGAQLKFLAGTTPAGEPLYFDANNHLTTVNTGNTGVTYIWVSVVDVVGDGYNFGDGNLDSGLGPITLDQYVPSGAFIDTSAAGSSGGIIPSFINTLPSAVLLDITNRISVNQDFYLIYYSSYTGNSWVVSTTPDVTLSTDTQWFVRFTHDSPNTRYNVTIKNVTYNFASVDQVRFAFDSHNTVYDPRTGKLIDDSVSIFKTNGTFLNTSLSRDVSLNITGQTVLSDGFANDYQVTVSSVSKQSGIAADPDFFINLVGTTARTSSSLVYFAITTNSDGQQSKQLMANGTVIYKTTYSGTNGAYTDRYAYPPGTVFFCATPVEKFYKSSVVLGVTPTEIIMTDVTSQYEAVVGRGGLSFLYKHNSGDTTRVDPSTTNIIDLYLVTQSYYTDYMNWLNDATNSVPKPTKPTINELRQNYGQLDSYKMISDSVVPNSVTFKPLFGKKADTNLQGTIKVVKSYNVTASDSQIRSAVLSAMNSYFSIDNWSFGDSFYFSELTAYLHVQLGALISSVVVVPADPSSKFGDLYEIRSAPDEIFCNGATTQDISVISALTTTNMNR